MVEKSRNKPISDGLHYYRDEVHDAVDRTKKGKAIVERLTMALGNDVI